MIMQGYRNPTDGLWDTPITFKVIMPLTHPGLHVKRNVRFKPTTLARQELNLQINHSQS